MTEYMAASFGGEFIRSILIVVNMLFTIIYFAEAELTFNNRVFLLQFPVDFLESPFAHVQCLYNIRLSVAASGKGPGFIG